jgi:hypothetical protein
MNKIILYHGSAERVEQPLLAKGKLTNDYGQGFYCTENPELAKEWASAGNNNGVANCYELDTTGLAILNLSAPQYNILHWLALLMKYRTIRLSTPLMKQAHGYLMEHFLLAISQYDVIIGYRADDSYFSFARAFVSNEISLHQLSRAMKLGELGEQFVLKSQKAFDRIHFVSGIEVSNAVYAPLRQKRDESAGAAYRAELEAEDLSGIFIRDIIKEGILPDDPRLQ